MTDETRAVVVGDDDAGNLVETEGKETQSQENGSTDDSGQNSDQDRAVTGELDKTPEYPKLSDDTMEFFKSKGWNGPEDIEKLAESYQNLEKEHSRVNLSLKEGELTDEDWSEFRSRTGAPEKADDYKFDPPKDMPDYVLYDDAMLEKHKEVAHKIGLNEQQFKAQTELIQEYMIDQQVQGYTRQLEMVDEAGDTLRNEWKNDVVLEQKLQTSFASINASPAYKDMLIQHGLLVPVDGQPGKYHPVNAALVQYHAEIGERMQNEPAGLSGIKAQTQIGSQNPWKKGDAWNETQQAAIIRSDPERARAMIVQAGEDPAEHLG